MGRTADLKNAEKACKEVNNKLKIANKQSDHSSHTSPAYFKSMTDAAAAKHAQMFGPKNSSSSGDAALLLEQGKAALESRQAVCADFAGAIAYLLKGVITTSLEIVRAGAMGDHFFVVIGREDLDPATINDVGSWGTAFVVDVWAHQDQNGLSPMIIESPMMGTTWYYQQVACGRLSVRALWLGSDSTSKTTKTPSLASQLSSSSSTSSSNTQPSAPSAPFSPPLPSRGITASNVVSLPPPPPPLQTAIASLVNRSTQNTTFNASNSTVANPPSSTSSSQQPHAVRSWNPNRGITMSEYFQIHGQWPPNEVLRPDGTTQRLPQPGMILTSEGWTYRNNRN